MGVLAVKWTDGRRVSVVTGEWDPGNLSSATHMLPSGILIGIIVIIEHGHRNREFSQ